MPNELHRWCETWRETDCYHSLEHPNNKSRAIKAERPLMAFIWAGIKANDCSLYSLHSARRSCKTEAAWTEFWTVLDLPLCGGWLQSSFTVGQQQKSACKTFDCRWKRRCSSSETTESGVKYRCYKYGGDRSGERSHVPTFPLSYGLCACHVSMFIINDLNSLNLITSHFKSSDKTRTCFYLCREMIKKEDLVHHLSK